MKLNRIFSVWLPALLAAAGLALGQELRAAPAAGGPASTSPGSGTNVVSHEVVIPKAVYELTGSAVRDPFFPVSSRNHVEAGTATNAVPTFNAAMFVFKGLSGTPRQRLAIINNMTLAEGESAEFSTLAGKIRVRCLAIHTDSVVIRLEGQPDPIELHFKNAEKSNAMFRYK